jgi:NAD(P)-dependent dehydrogenase (short-subunit alcohol dehydrogenase family)
MATSASPVVALVIGASSGIGRATAHLLASRHGDLVLLARDATRLEVVADECRAAGAGVVTVVAGDVLDRGLVERTIADAVARHGRIDLAVQTAAVMAYGTIEELPSEVFERVVDVTVKGTANVARAILPQLRRQDAGGTLVVVTSLLASVPIPMVGAYITAKWAQLGLTRVLQLETRAAPDVHVCSVAPAAIDTPIFRHAARFGTGVPGPPPPVASPEKVARAIVACHDRPRRNRNVGLVNRVVITGFRLVPDVFDLLVGPLFRRTFSGDGATTTEGNVFGPRHDAELADDEGGEDDADVGEAQRTTS